MSTQVRTTGNADTTSLVGSAIIGGILGGIFVDAFLSVMMHKSVLDIWQFVASTLIGPAAYTSPAYAILGCAMHFVISIVWAVAYLYAAGAVGQLRNWLLGAIVWGIVVDAAMNLLLAIKLGQPFVPAFTQGLIAHIVFYALPVTAYIAYRAKRA